jgi:hypothetical protein
LQRHSVGLIGREHRVTNVQVAPAKATSARRGAAAKQLLQVLLGPLAGWAHLTNSGSLNGPEIRAEHLIADVVSRHAPLH